MWTRGKDENHPGKFCYELFDANGTLVERMGKFDTAQEADRAAERVQRLYLLHPDSFIPCSGDNLTDEELDAALEELLLGRCKK